jgi:hypothetical protein
VCRLGIFRGTDARGTDAGPWAVGKIVSIRNGKPLRFVFLVILRPSADALGLGLGLGGPSVAQGPPKGHPREAQASIAGNVFVCNERQENGGRGWLSGLKSAGRGLKRLPKLSKSPELPQLKTDPLNPQRTGTQRLGRWSQARVPVPLELSQARAPALHDPLRFGA